MSRYYEITMKISDYNEIKIDCIAKVIEAEWSIDDLSCSQTRNEAWFTGRDYLSGGKSEEEFAKKVARAIMLANNGPCEVDVRATYLEELPYESYCFNEEHYQNWFDALLPNWLFENGENR